MNALGVLCDLPSVLHDAVLCIGRFEHSTSGFNLWPAIYLKIDQSSTLLSVFFTGNSPSRVGSTKVGYDLLFRDLAMTLGIYFHHIRQTVALVKQLKIPKHELSWLTSDQVASFWKPYAAPAITLMSRSSRLSVWPSARDGQKPKSSSRPGYAMRCESALKQLVNPFNFTVIGDISMVGSLVVAAAKDFANGRQGRSFRL